MPYLQIQTNNPISQDRISTLVSKASQTVSELLGKPEKYVMVAVRPDTSMLFSGSDSPTAFLELKSIGLPDSMTGKLSQALCSLIQGELGIAPDRIYIEFSDAPRKMWGWNNETF